MTQRAGLHFLPKIGNPAALAQLHIHRHLAAAKPGNGRGGAIRGGETLMPGHVGGELQDALVVDVFNHVAH